MRIFLALAILALTARVEAQTPTPPLCPALRACVSWTAPTTNTDGTAYTNPGGYRILWGRTASSLFETTYVNDPAARSWTSPVLAVGTWYFTVRAVNALGFESANGNTASKIIRAPAPTDGAIEAPTDGSIEPGENE